jgi:hypothetical protein
VRQRHFDAVGICECSDRWQRYSSHTDAKRKCSGAAPKYWQPVPA